MKILEPVARKVRFGIATDEPISGTGLHSALRGDDQFRIIWLPASMERLTQAVQYLSVDVVMIDMACEFPVDVADQLRAQGLTAPIILWMRDDGSERSYAGPMDYPTVVLDKRGAPEMILACVETVLAGRKWHEGQQHVAPLMISEPQPSPIHVSPREAELMDLVAEGLSNRQIAERLQLTEGSVKVYFSRLFRKLGIPDRVALALYSVRHPWDDGITRSPLRGGARKAPPRRLDS